MKYRGIKKIHEGKFITRYDIDYLTEEGRTKTYEMISRNRNIESLEDLQNKKADSVVMILTDESGERILVSREFRMAMAQSLFGSYTQGKKAPSQRQLSLFLWLTGIRLHAIASQFHMDVRQSCFASLGASDWDNIVESPIRPIGFLPRSAEVA